MDGLGIPPDQDDDLLFGLVPSWSTAVLASAVGLAGIAIWRRYLAPPGPSRPTTKGTAPAGTTRPAVPSPKVRKPAPWVPNTEAEDLLAAATEEEQKKLRPLIASLAPTSDHNAQIKAARATLFYVQDESQWSMMRRTGVLSAMVRLLVTIANHAAQRGGDGDGGDIGVPSREEAAVLAALSAALSRLCRAPELREAMATPELVEHAVFLLRTPLVDSTKAELVALLNVFVRLGDDLRLRAAMVDGGELGPVLAQLFLQTTIESGEDIIKHSANALVPFVTMDEGKITRDVLLEHGGVEHALDLFTEGRAKFAKRRTPLALLALLNALSAVADVETCEKVLSASLAQYFVAELRKNQKVSLRQNLPDLLSLLRAFLVQERAGAADANDLRRQFQDFFLEEQDDGTTGLEQVMSFLRDDKLFPDAAEVLLGLSLDNSRVQAGIKENEEAMAAVRAASETASHPGSEAARLLLARVGV